MNASDSNPMVAGNPAKGSTPARSRQLLLDDRPIPLRDARVFIVAGERSGDAHAAELLEALKEAEPDAAWEFRGLGGPLLREASNGQIEDWVEQAAVVGLWEVIKRYPWFKKRFNEVLSQIARQLPDVVVLVDYPGFNLRLAARLRQCGYKGKIIYYISPQVWAWNRGRIPKMARTIDLMLCIFPFEPELYQPAGLKSVFIGHPLVEQLQPLRGQLPRNPDLIGLFPGSREREVSKHFPILIEATKWIRQKDPAARFEAAAASETLAGLMRSMLSEHGMDTDDIRISVEDSRNLMQRARTGAVASGTATIEAAILGMPLVILYKVAWLTWMVGKMLVKVEFLGMVNLLARREIAPEFLQNDATAEAIGEALLKRLRDQYVHEKACTELATVADQLGRAGAAHNAASAMIELLRENP